MRSLNRKLRNLFQKSLISDTHGNVVIPLLITVTVVIVLYALIPVIGYNVDSSVTIPGDASARGTFTFSGNVSNGELVNITSGTAVYRFEFNTTANGSAATAVTANAIVVNLTSGYNSSVRASGNLTAAINANASTSALVTAVNTTNVTTLTAPVGTAGNNIGLSENAANVIASGAFLTGGTAGSQWNSSVNPNLPTGVGIWTTIGALIKVILIIAAIAVALFILVTRLGGLGGAGNTGL